MKRWIRWCMLAGLLALSGALAIACSNPVPGDEQATESTTNTENGTETTAGTDASETAPQENPPTPDATPDASNEPAPPPDTTPPTESQPTESQPTESQPTEPPPPWTKDEPAPPKPYSGGTCPTLKPGTNTIKSGGKERTFDLYLPQLVVGSPLLFMWHGLGDNPQNFARSFGAANLSSTRKVIIVVPKGMSGPTIPPDVAPGIVTLLKQNAQPFFETWSFFGDPTADLTLFDDVLACLSKQYQIDRTKVYTSGFSAGALWSTYLTMHRSEYLAASLILSGGVMKKILDLATIPFLGSKSKVTVIDIPYTTPSHKVPVMLTAGGSQDMVSMASFISFEFQPATDALRKGLVADQHFVIQCNHTAGHTFPQGLYQPAIEFLFQHTFSRKPSPYAKNPLPGDFPAYCKKMAP